jgi:hypothetical protein
MGIKQCKAFRANANDVRSGSRLSHRLKTVADGPRRGSACSAFERGSPDRGIDLWKVVRVEKLRGLVHAVHCSTGL